MKTIEQLKIEITLKILAGEELEWKYAAELPKDNDLRTFICSLEPLYAFWYALYVDKSPRAETRESAYRDPYYKQWYIERLENRSK